jgi:isopenicillin-N epimerase
VSASAPSLSLHWGLDPRVTFLNHGSFGACPRAVLAAQERLRDEMERDPMHFFVREFEGRVDRARASLAGFVGADPDDLVPVANATQAVNAVLRSLAFEPGDELLVGDHEYNACRNALEFAAARAGARVVVARIPFPLEGPEQVVEAVLACVGPRTRLALLDHVTSPTGLVLPIERLVAELAARGVESLVDGAHAPGMVELDVSRIGAAFYAGNCHKWLCAPKGAGFLVTRRDAQARVRPTSISHGANSPRRDRSRYLIEFGWTGTDDPTAFLCVPAAIDCVGSLLPGGWPEVMRRNRATVLAGRRRLCEALAVEPPAPESMIGSLASLPLPDARAARVPGLDPLQETLYREHLIEVPVSAWPAPPRRLLRISAQLYNGPSDYERLAAALPPLL